MPAASRSQKQCHEMWKFVNQSHVIVVISASESHRTWEFERGLISAGEETDMKTSQRKANAY
jgi:hypothetical protein